MFNRKQYMQDYSKEYRNTHKEEARKYQKEYRKTHKKEMKVYQKKHRTPTRISWRRMLERCNNPNHVAYHRYGGRGIKVLYGSYREFVQDVGIRPSKTLSIDRINNDGNYEPGNCRWATDKQQQNNRSCVRNHGS